jgi:hypothetical protein
MHCRHDCLSNSATNVNTGGAHRIRTYACHYLQACASTYAVMRLCDGCLDNNQCVNILLVQVQEEGAF